MIFDCYILEGNCIKDLNTEIRYSIAAGRANGCELIKLTISDPTGSESEKVLSCALRILGTMKREGHLQFYVKNVLDGSRESEYLNNKYSEHLKKESVSAANSIYVKL